MQDTQVLFPRIRGIHLPKEGEPPAIGMEMISGDTLGALLMCARLAGPRVFVPAACLP